MPLKENDAAEFPLDATAAKLKGESSHRSQHLNGNRQSVSRAELSINQWAIGLSRGPFSFSLFSVVPIRHPFS